MQEYNLSINWQAKTLVKLNCSYLLISIGKVKAPMGGKNNDYLILPSLLEHNIEILQHLFKKIL